LPLVILPRIVSRTICLALMLCTSAGALAAPTVDRPVEPRKVLDIPFFLGGEGREFFEHAAVEFEKARPDVRVDMELDPRIVDKVRVRVLERKFFEVTNAFINYWPLIKNGDVVALDEWLDAPSVDQPGLTWRQTFLPGALDPYKWNDKTYGVPLGYFISVVWYNKKMFREHGWTVPETWEQFYELCDKVKATGTIEPLAFQGRYADYTFPLVDAPYYQLAGPDRWDAQKQLEPGGFNNPEMIQSLAYAQRLATQYFQPGALGMNHTDSQLQFFIGKTAMIPCGSWLKSEMLGKIPDGFELGCFNVPDVPNPVGSKDAVFATSNYYFVMSRSKHPREGVEFLRLMTSKRLAGDFARMTDIPVAVKGASEGNLSRDMDDLLALINKADGSYGMIKGEATEELRQIQIDALQKLNSAAMTPEQVALQLETQSQLLRSRLANPLLVKVNHRVKPALLIGALGLAAIYWVWSTARAIRRRGTASPHAAADSPSVLQRMRWGYVLLFIAPAAIPYTLFVIVPSLRAFLWSVHDWNGLTSLGDMPYRGLLNFRRLLLESDGFWIALRNNLFLMVVVPAFVIPFSLFLAACISRGIGGAKLFRVVFFFPNLIGGVAAALLWLHLYNPQGGLVNSALAGIGFESFRTFTWLSPDHLYWALIPMSIWGACGFNMVLYLAAMENVPESLYESATIEGASPWHQFWAITVPLIWEVLAISVVFMVIGGMKAFDMIWLLTNQRPTTDTHVISTRMVQTMFWDYKVSEATAIAVVLFFMVFLGTAATLRVMRRERVEM
jgi:ABC-type sugar transport system permease subunit/ABC-type glycerol-3-phosphate transport system substrate-binding protein